MSWRRLTECWQDWLDDHPLTMLYVVVVTSINLCLSVVEALSR